MPTFAPQLTKTWTISPNLRRPYTSLADQIGWLFYENKTKLLAAGWTVKFSSAWTGAAVVGPSSGADTTDRWTSIAAIHTSGRGTALATVQSWCVLQNSDGLQIMFDYQGASDDIGRISYSPGGLFVINGTDSRYQPTATDEVLTCNATSLVISTPSQDRVMHIWTTTDTKHWSFALFRAGGLQHVIGVECVTSYCGVNVFTVPYVGYRHNNLTFYNNPTFGTVTPITAVPSSPAFGTANHLSTHARVFTNAASRIVRVGAGWIEVAHIADGFTRTYNDVFFNDIYPALQGSRGAPCYPLIWSGERTTNLDGILGSPIDWWLCHTNQSGVPARSNMLPGFDVGDNPNTDPVRSNWCVALGNAMVRPWKNAAAAMLQS